MNGHRIYDLDRAVHPFRAALLDAHCAICGELAAHEVIEICGGHTEGRTGCLCCHHFSWILTDCEPASPDLPAQRETESPP